MRIAMPIAEGKFALHYGSCETLSIHDIDLQRGVAMPVAVVDAPAEGMCGAGPWIASQGVQVLLAGGLGAGAAQGLGKAGVRVFAGIKETDPAKVLEMFLDGVAEARELAPGESMCRGHEDGHEHRHGADHVCTCGSH